MFKIEIADVQIMPWWMWRILLVSCRTAFWTVWKIMDGRISQKIRYLCKIHIIFTNQLFGKVNLHTGKEFDNSALIFFTEKLLKLRTSNHIVLGDIFNRQRLPHMFSEIVDDIPAGFRACLTGIINPCRSRIMCDSVSADHMDQKFFEIQRQKLLRTKRDSTFLTIFQDMDYPGEKQNSFLLPQ